MEPIREKIFKQSAAACSVSGGALKLDPVKLAWNNGLEPLRAWRSPTLCDCTPPCFHSCFTLSAAGPCVPFLLPYSHLLATFFYFNSWKQVWFFPAVSASLLWCHTKKKLFSDNFLAFIIFDRLKDHNRRPLLHFKFSFCSLLKECFLGPWNSFAVPQMATWTNWHSPKLPVWYKVRKNT